MNTKRLVGMDIVRIVAVLFVIAVHSLSYNGYYSLILGFNSGIYTFFLTMCRWLFCTCVPLFLIITGYLKLSKVRINAKYYVSLIRIIVDYLIVCFIYLIYQRFVLNMDVFNLASLKLIVNFKLISYSWYLQMYVILFMLIPFINMFYKRLNKDNYKLGIIAFLAIICSFIPLFDSLLGEYYFAYIIYKLLSLSYAIMYYLIGAYIREHNFNFNKCKLFVSLVFVLITQTIVTYLHCDGNIFSWKFMDAYSNVFTIFTSIFVFLIFYNINLDRIVYNKCYGKFVTKVIAYMSKTSLLVYLLSYFVDLYIYRYIKYLYIPWYISLFILLLTIIIHYLICLFMASIIELFKFVIVKSFNLIKNVILNVAKE